MNGGDEGEEEEEPFPLLSAFVVISRDELDSDASRLRSVVASRSSFPLIAAWPCLALAAKAVMVFLRCAPRVFRVDEMAD